MIHDHAPLAAPAIPAEPPLWFPSRATRARLSLSAAANPTPCQGGGQGEPRPQAESATVAEVVALRREQVDRWGHTAEKDAARPLGAFLVDVASIAAAAREDCQFRRPRAQVRKRLVKLAALALATIDRIDREPGDE